jgi:hypothetical protein
MSGLSGEDQQLSMVCPYDENYLFALFGLTTAHTVMNFNCQRPVKRDFLSLLPSFVMFVFVRRALARGLIRFKAEPEQANEIFLAGKVTVVTVGYHHTCVATSADGIWCWGCNFRGALGTGTQADQSGPDAPVSLSAGTRQKEF